MNVSGDPLATWGIRNVNCTLANCANATTPFMVAKVERPVLSVWRLREAGVHLNLLIGEGSYLFNASGQHVKLED
eukprot:9296730-Alexandrium_andersonii.AAC.1